MDLRVNSAHDVMRETISQNRPILRDLQSNLFPNTNVMNKKLVEISGAENSGKTRILQYFLANCIATNRTKNASAMDILLIDLEHKFDSQHFSKQLEDLFLSAGMEESEAKTLAIEDLHHVFLVNYYTVDELECGLLGVEQTLMDNKQIALVAIDGLDAFYWLESRKQLIRMNTYYAKLTTILQKISTQNNICCAFTVDSNFLKEKTTKAFPSHQKNIDFRLEINIDSHGDRQLNGKPFFIDDSGVHFN